MAIQRYFRLLPLILFSILTAFILLNLGLFFCQETGNVTKSTWWLSQHYNFIPNFIEMLKQAFYGVFFQHQSSYNDPLWTMTYEIYGSFLIFGFLYILGKTKIRYIAYIILIALFIDNYYGAFVYGLLISDIYNNHHEITNRIKINQYIPILILIIGIIIGAYPPVNPSINSIYQYIELKNFNSMILYHNLGAMLVTISIFTSQKLKTFFSKKILLYAGKISFATYVIHVIIITSLSSYLFLKFNKFLPYHLNFALTFGISITMIMIFAHFIQKYIDQPSVKTLKLAYYKIDQLFKPHSKN